jgi:hypothetical protein
VEEPQTTKAQHEGARGGGRNDGTAMRRRVTSLLLALYYLCSFYLFIFALFNQ